VGLNKSHWRKSATWFALNRKHAEVFVNETVTEAAWDPVPCCDEHYLPTILAFNGLDNETTCSDGFAHVYWESLTASHPHWFSADEISEDLFAKRFHRPPNSGGGPGFSQLCSGNVDVCHFTARKFSWNTRYALLENIQLVLNDNKSNLVYDKDQWAHYNERLRVTNESKYYVLDSGYWRQVPDMFTLHAMHLNESKATELSETDKAGHQFGTTYPSRRDGQALKAPKRNYIFLIKGGKKRGIPNMETLAALGMGLWNVTVVNEWDLEQIPMGHPVPDIKSNPDIKAQLIAGTF
jgi:Core-2/I-Branching enzyme